MKGLKSFIATASALLMLSSCSPFKTTTSSEADLGNNRKEYTMILEKDAADYLEIVDVKLMNSETKANESVTFQVMDTQKSTVLLNLRGYEAFSIIATCNNAELNPDQALVVYKDEVDGDSKTTKIKPLVTPRDVN